ncbi:hypothetical protein [Agaribacter marinus]|uniref:DUF4340 domain-containing protein n=1 Tax=Agaribacter marinus TaxID=1431249 RepID=A0AA37SSH2_9ALTE|nr:hypothetical protein [Agaribacter marinus]GLR69111.1 hypothetical protein GCM10007852_00190 [Agaribacter marinus]
MRRLSQKAWNNVLIFSMLILIVVLNWDKLFGEGELSVISVVPEGAVILNVEIDELNFERVGTGWRVVGPESKLRPNLTSKAIAEIIGKWERALLRLPLEQVEPTAFYPLDHVVTIWIAGQKNGLVYSIKTIAEQTYFVHESRYYLLDFPSLSQLMP